MKMKKIVCSLMISVLCFMTAISGVSAASYDTSKIDTAYSKVIEYYKNNSNLDNADKILAVESLGLEAESNQFDISLDILLKKNSKMVQSMDKERAMGIKNQIKNQRMTKKVFQYIEQLKNIDTN